MKQRKPPLLSILSLGVVLLATAPAQAAIISYSDSHASDQTEWDDILSVNQFDPTLGTLNKVTLTLEGSILSDIILDNDNTTTESGIGFTNSNMSMSSLAGLASTINWGVNPTTSTGLQNLGPDDSVGPVGSDNPGDGGPDEASLTGLTDTDDTMLMYTPVDADFAAFIGVGTLDTVGFGTLSGVGASGIGGNLEIDFNTFAGAVLTVEYDYTPDAPAVPAPSAMLLFGTGLLGLVGWRVRRTTSS